jgi:hypothetical protein
MTNRPKRADVDAAINRAASVAGGVVAQFAPVGILREDLRLLALEVLALRAVERAAGTVFSMLDRPNEIREMLDMHKLLKDTLQPVPDAISPGDVVQLDTGMDWGPLLCIVDKVHEWGVRCYALVPSTRNSPPEQMHLRAPVDQYVRIGEAKWVSRL